MILYLTIVCVSVCLCVDRVDLLGFRVSLARFLGGISIRGLRVVLAMLWG